MNRYDNLVGQAFSWQGRRFTVVKCEGATVLAALLRDGCVERVLVPVDQVLDALDVTEITMTELPTEDGAVHHP